MASSSIVINVILLILFAASVTYYKSMFCDSNTNAVFAMWYISFLLIIINFFLMSKD